MITDKTLEKYLELMAETDELIGEAWGRVKAGEHLVKQTKAQVFLRVTGTVAQRENEAACHPEVIRAQNDYENAEAEYKTIWAQRETAKFHIEVWRSQNSARRQGHV